MTPPEPQRTILDRSRVMAALDEATSRYRMTLVIAPAGGGKTTAMSQWARTRAESVGWISLTRFDDDPYRIWCGIMSALRRVAPDSGDPSLEALLSLIPHPTDHARSEEALAATLEGIPSPIILVMDDAHLAGQPLLDTVVAAMIDRPPPNLRLILSARPSIAGSLLRPRLHGFAGTVDAEILRFTRHEIESAAAALDRPIDEPAAQAIRRATSGWPVAVRAALMSADAATPDVFGEGSVAGTMLADYVVEEILDGLDPDLVEFILAATTSSRLDVEMAKTVTNRPDAANLLEECVRRGLFLDRYTRKDANPLYRWHGVFAEQCRSILRRRDPGRADRLNQLVAAELADRYPMQAVIHALGGQAPAQAARIIEDNWLWLVVQFHARLLARACQSLPAPWAEDPAILLIRACCLDLDEDRVGGSLLFDRASALIDQVEPGRREQLALVQALTTLIVADDRDRLVAACEQVEALLRGRHSLRPAMSGCALFVLGWAMTRIRYSPRHAAQLLRTAADSCAAAGLPSVAQRAAANLSFSLAFSGQFGEAKEVLATVPDPGRRKVPWLNVDGSITYFTAGFMAYWQDDLASAWDLLTQGVRLGGGAASYATYSRVFLVWVATAMGDTRRLAEAQMGLTRVPTADARGAPWGAYRNHAHALIAEAYGHREVALSLARRVSDFQAIPMSAAECADLLRRCGDAHQAMLIVKDLGTDEQPTYVSASLLMTEALIQAGQGASEAAHLLLERSLGFAVPEEVRRPYLNAGDEMRALLERHSAWGTRYDRFVADLLARSGHPVAAATRREPLSRRELEVLGFLRTTMTNAEIAAALHVSVNTLKTHQRAIYRKLGVGDRRAAIRAYRDGSLAGITPPG